MARQETAGAGTRNDEIPILTGAMAFLKEFLYFLSVRKKFWLFPVLLVVLILGGLVVFTQGSAIAPFIYAIF